MSSHERQHPRLIPMIKLTEIKPTPKKGRPRIEDKAKSFEATKPWLELGMSRRTWYARRKEALASGLPPKN